MLAGLGIDCLSGMQQDAVQTLGHHDNGVLLAPTGSGKTVAFLLPLTARLDSGDDLPQALVLSPTRELSQQTFGVWQAMKTHIRISCLHGGRPAMEEHRQMNAWKPQALVGTPGRVLDHFQKGNFPIHHLRHLVIDEYDKMLELKFQDELLAIVRLLDGLKTHVLVSATDSPSIATFPPFVRHRPIVLDYSRRGKDVLPESVRHHLVLSPQKDKLETLRLLLSGFRGKPAVVYVGFREAVERIGTYLKNQGYAVSLFHGGLEQEDRERALYLFKGGAANVLVSTDLSARGMDIRSLRHVVHYHLPMKEEDYFHRCGRTGRWDDEGDSFVLIGPDEKEPSYAGVTFTPFIPMTSPLPPVRPDWTLLYIGRGKKDKIGKGDVVGFLCKQGGAVAEDIGSIDVRDRYVYVAVRRGRCQHILSQCAHEKIKKMRTRIELVHMDK